MSVGSSVTRLTYDVENRVTSITYPGSATNSFAYNGEDLRTRKVDSAGTKNYVTDGATPASAVLSDGNAVYTPGLSERRGTTSKFYHADALGSTRGITDSTQATTDAQLYDAFGMTVSRTGTTPFGFVGKEQYQTDSDSGLQLLGHRYYDPSIGRFLSQDPIQDGTNWYAYCDNNPIKKLDPTGKIGLVGGLIGAGIGAVVGGVGAYITGGDVWVGAGRGAIIGGIAGFTGGLGYGAVASIGAPSWIAGAVGGAVGSAVSQGYGIAMGWQEGFSWGNLAISTGLGGIIGALPQPVTHWNPAGPTPIASGEWGQVGFRDPISYIQAGGPQAGWGLGNGSTSWISPGDMRFPTSGDDGGLNPILVWAKGAILGQRILK